MLKATLKLKRDINISKYRAIKLICNRVIHGFESVCLLRLICRDLTCVLSSVYWSVEFK
jgi:hypothetical protein